jgi:hypothetical protein
LIRLAISCDICGAEKKQTNHWFVAYEQAGELRISGWNSRHCKRTGARHLCGQTCLHKLVDEFMAQAIEGDRAVIAAEQAAAEAMGAAEAMSIETRAVPVAPAVAHVDASLTSRAAYEDEYGSSARLIPTPAPVSDMRSAAETPAIPQRIARVAPVPQAEEAPKYVSHQWRSAAWERERARELHGDADTRRRKVS